MRSASLGFWIAGSVDDHRILVDAGRAFSAFCACDESVRVDGEHYLSAFNFGPEFRGRANPSSWIVEVAGYGGICGTDWAWWDIDRKGNLSSALADTRALCLHLADQGGVDQDHILVFFSGSKGYHVGVPTALWEPAPSLAFNQVAHRFAHSIAARAGGAGVSIDSGIYDKVRAFRAPNSRHAKTGLHKRRLTVDELLGLSAERIAGLATAPAAFELPEPKGSSPGLAAAWTSAEAGIKADAQAREERRRATESGGGPDQLNALTLEFIREGAPEGGPNAPDYAGRNRRLFAAAVNLGELGCPPKLAHALLTRAALDCGLSPSEVRRQIDNGLMYKKPGAKP